MIKFAVAAVAAVALTQTIQATPITGSVTFSSATAVLNGTSVGTSTEVVNWGTVSASGTLNGVAVAPTASFFPSWYFAGTPTTLPINNFWTVGNYSFQLASFTESVVGGFLLLNFTGTVSDTIDGYTSAVFAGSGSFQDPNGGAVTGGYKFSGSLSFNSVPDGGTTVMLLGAALSGLALIKRKLVA